MKHISLASLRRIRLLLMAYNAHFIVGYFYLVFGFHQGWVPHSAYFTPLLAGLAGIYFLFEIVSYFTIMRRSVWIAAIGSYLCALTIGVLAIDNTGVYLSPYIIAILIYTFIGVAFSQYISWGVVLMFLFGYLMSLAHVFRDTDGGAIVGLGFMILDIITATTGYFLFRRFYEVAATPEMENLNRSLRKSQVQVDIVLQSIADGVVLIDDQQIIRLLNPGASTITGWTPTEAEGLDWSLVFTFVDAKGTKLEKDASPLGKVFQSGQIVRDNSANLLTKSNKTIGLNITVSPLLDESKRVTGAVGVFRDVSEERQAENQRAEFISTASHEMRTPVAAIEGYLSLALNDKVASIDMKARDYLEKAHASTQHLGQLFQDLLTSAKAEDGRLTNHPKVVEMGAYLEQLVQDLKFSAEKKGLFMEFTFGAASESVDATHNTIRPLYFVQVDPDRMREVITNIFDNAVKYTDQGKINIGITGNEQVVQFYVRDTGPGIPTEDIPHLFQKFYRVDSSATRTIGGTGLGLFISRKIVELYNGRIWVESELGKGTSFFINLPRLNSQRAEELQLAESQSTTLAPIATTNGL